MRAFVTLPLAALFCAVALGLGLTSCSHYHLGTGSKLTFATIYIAPVINGSDLPQAAALVTAQLREAFLRDGRVALVETPGEADAVLTVTLASYGRETLTAQATDTGLARKFGLTLKATATLRNRHTGQTLFEQRPLQAQRQLYTDSGQLLAEYDAVPLLAENLAQSALHAALDVW
jgi:outer membrane lipopolysaccharide assembly protein LptE/RlpB